MTTRTGRPARRRRPNPTRERLLALLPRPVYSGLRTLYLALRPRPETLTVTLADDVADADSLRDYLADNDIFTDPTEGADYIRHSFERFRVTLSIIPRLGPGARVLELGANPYFMTRLLRRRGCDVTCANFFGDNAVADGHGSQTVSSPRHGERAVFEFDHFNVEADRFPYPDDSFDVVLCCEILEHLPHDPTHLLAEIHRVLIDTTGLLVLTTPNALRTENLDKMLAGRNIYEQLSGYGAYGRHNRVYTISELETLLDDLGYTDVKVFAADLHPIGPGPEGGPGTVRADDYGENLFATARATGAARWRYPPWLYASRAAYRRTVRPDVLVGVNDDVQASGLHDRETRGSLSVRWTGPAPATVHVVAPRSGPHRLVVEGWSPPAPVQPPLRLTATVGDQDLDWVVASDDGPFRLESLVTADGELDVVLRTDHTWRRRDTGLGDDGRDLGVGLTHVVLEAVEPG